MFLLVLPPRKKGKIPSRQNFLNNNFLSSFSHAIFPLCRAKDLQGDDKNSNSTPIHIELNGVQQAEERNKSFLCSFIVLYTSQAMSICSVRTNKNMNKSFASSCSPTTHRAV